MSSSFREKVSRNLSLTGWMHNRRLTLVLSFLLAIVLWVVVMSDSNNIQTRTMTVPVHVDLNDTLASQSGLHLVSESDLEVSVTVRGAWSVLSALTPNDVLVRADVSPVQKAGTHEVSLLLSRNSAVVNYDLVSVSPATISVVCDYWDSQTFAVEADIASLKVTDESSLRIGTPKLSSETLTVEGPQTTLNKIKKLVARVGEQSPLSGTETFTAALIALDEKGQEVSLDHCSFEGLDRAEIKVRVPVEAYKELTFTYEWLHAPETMADSADYVTLSPESVTVVGPADAVNSLPAKVNLYSVDFDHLTSALHEWSPELNLPNSVKVVGDVSTVVMTLDLSDYTTKTLSLPLSGDTVTFQNKPVGKTATVQAQTATITLCGPSSALNSLTADDLSVSVDLSGATGTAATAYAGRVTVRGTKSVWVYYGEDSSGVDVYVTLS